MSDKEDSDTDYTTEEEEDDEIDEIEEDLSGDEEDRDGKNGVSDGYATGTKKRGPKTHTGDGEDDVEDGEAEDDIEEEPEEDEIEVDFDSDNEDTRVHRSHVLETFHPECKQLISSEIQKLANVTRDERGKIIDTNHRTLDIITKYEFTKIIGFRATQIANGAPPFIEIPPHITDVVDVAEYEMKHGLLPYIIQRPVHRIGQRFEYWRIADLRNPYL
jgi:DNA-directed RNA polymerase subunit K/omega